MESTHKPETGTAMIAYLTIIGWIIALVLNNDKKNAFVSFHVRQMLGIMILAFSITLLMRLTGVPLLGILHLGTIALWIIGFMGAMKGEATPVPVFGEQFQDWFRAIS